MGGTKKVTISLRPADLDAMVRFAKRRHAGNLSGAFAELIEDASRLDAMDRVIEELPAPTREDLARLEAEMTAPLRRPKGDKRAKRTRAA